MRALVIEDDPRYGAHLEKLLGRAGFLVDLETEPEDALRLGLDTPYAVIVLDLMLTLSGGRRAVDGFSLLRRWRKAGVATPVLVLTASRTDLEDTTMSYELDADYEIKRPGAEFDALLLAWAKSRAARSAAAAGRASPARAGRLGLDPDQRTVRLGDETIDLTRTEFNVLMAMVRAPSAWISAADIAKSAFDDGCENPQAQVYEYVKRLRQKLGVDVIKNRRGLGYRVDLDDAAA